MPVGTGISSQIGMAQETVYGTQVAVTRFLEFNTESLALTKNTVQGMGLHAGGLFVRGARRAQTTRQAAGSVSLNAANKGLGLLLQHMVGSFGQTLATPTQIGVTGAYKQVHQGGSVQGKSFTLQKGVPQTDGTVKPFTYPGCKVTEWELTCGTGEIAVFNVGIDAADELTLATSPASNALATASYATASEFNFVQGALLTGGTASTTSGLVSISGGTQLAAVTAASVKYTRPLKTDRFFLGAAGVKAEPLEDGFVSLSGSITAEFATQAALYDAFRADTSLALQLTFTGPAIGASNYMLEVMYPQIKFDGQAPSVDGPGVVTLTAPLTAFDDQTNAACQVIYTSTDVAL